MDKLILEFVGKDDWNLDTYKDTRGNFFKNTNDDDTVLHLYTVAGGLEGEPSTPINTIDKYKNMQLQVLNPPLRPSKQDRFNYMMLSRLEQDCKYFLGNGNRNAKYLWALNVPDHIKEMKNLYNSFDDTKKPDWISWDDILQYERQMGEVANNG